MKKLPCPLGKIDQVLTTLSPGIGQVFTGLSNNSNILIFQADLAQILLKLSVNNEVSMSRIYENPANMKEYLSVADMAKEFGIHEMTFYRMIRDKKIPAFKIGSQWRIRRADLEKWLENRCSLPAE